MKKETVKTHKRFFREKDMEIGRILIQELESWKDTKAPTSEEFYRLVDRLASV